MEDSSKQGESKLNAMRKRLITPLPHDAPLLGEKWLDLDGAGVVEVSSEEEDSLSNLR